MNVDVTIGARLWRVGMVPTGQPDRIQVTVKGRRREFEVVWIGGETLSLRSIDDGRTCEIAIRQSPGWTGSRGELEVALGSQLFRAIVAEEGAVGKRVEAASGSPNGSRAVVSPMPGRIVRILVTSGATVVAGQPVIVIEAMKMENELRAQKDGVVREIAVKEGMAIEAGAPLVVVD